MVCYPKAPPQHWNLLQIKAYFPERDDEELHKILRRIEVLKDLNVVAQRQQEHQRLEDWGRQRREYNERQNAGILPWLCENDERVDNPEYKVYPAPKPRSIDAFSNENNRNGLINPNQ